MIPRYGRRLEEAAEVIADAKDARRFARAMSVRVMPERGKKERRSRKKFFCAKPQKKVRVDAPTMKRNDFEREQRRPRSIHLAANRKKGIFRSAGARTAPSRKK
jgi:plasmid stabilization system protein ParE